MKIHPSDLTLEDMLISESGKGPLLRHLGSCPQCRSRLGALSAHPSWRAGLVGASPGPLGAGSLRSIPSAGNAGQSVDYGPAIERSERKYLEHARVIQQERAEAPRLLAELLAHQPEKRELLLANSPRFQTWGFYELLVDRSWESRGTNRTQSEELVDLAVHLAPHLDTALYPRQVIEDLKARAWSYRANLRRLASDFEGAEEAFQVAYAHLKLGSREPLERAVFLDLKASLRGTQRRLAEAKRLLHRAIAIFLHQGDEHRAGKSLLSLSWVHSNADETEKAVIVLQQALQLIDPAQDDRLLLCAWHDLIEYQTHLGRFLEAQGLYRKARPLYRKYQEDSEFAPRRLWVKGRIARGLGQALEAEALFIAARERYLANQIPYDAALVSMELAMLFAEQDRTAELKQLGTEMLSIFTSRHVHREAMAALMFVKQAIDAEKLTIQTAARITNFLTRSAGDPSLKFEAQVNQK